MRAHTYLTIGLVVGLLLGSGAREASATQEHFAGPPSINADKVDGFDASASPVANTLLALNGQAKFPVSAIPQGAGSGLNADSVDGLHAIDFAASNHNHDNRYYTKSELNTPGGSQVHWGNLLGVPTGLSDGDNDLLANITCNPAQVLKYFNNAWTCGTDQTVGTTVPIMQYDNIPGSEFNPTALITDSDWQKNQGILFAGSQGVRNFEASIHLPDGALITELSANVIDNDNIQDIRIQLSANADDGSASLLLANVSSSGAPGLVTLTQGLNHTIDNRTKTYTVNVFIIRSSEQIDNRLMNVRISYTVP